jgi:hypothetical protein
MPTTLGDLIERHVNDEGESKAKLLRWYRNTEKEVRRAEERLKQATERMGKVEGHWLKKFGCTCGLHGITCTHKK